MNPYQIIIVGPTASGKSELAMQLANLWNIEIICADSRTVYKGMDIGTAKPSPADRLAVNHYCLDIVEPNQPFTVAQFVNHANSAKNIIIGHKAVPVIVGGSGLFIDAFAYNYSFIQPRLDIRQKYSSMDIPSLHNELQSKGIVLPANSLNKRHLLLALERQGAVPSKQDLPSSSIFIGINPPKDILHAAIKERAKAMVAAGVYREVKSLYKKYGNQKAFLGGAYGALQPSISINVTEEALIEALVSNDIKLAKKQLTWFKRNPDIKWFTSTKDAYSWLQQYKHGGTL